MSSTELAILENADPWDWPEDATEMILSVLGDLKTEEEDRLLAARLAADSLVMDDAVASALVATLRDDKQSVELRSQAALSLGPALEAAELDALVSAADLGLEGLEHVDLDDTLLSPKMLGEVKRTLRSLYHDAAVPTHVRRRVLEAAVRGPEDWQEDAVRASYATGDPAWRLTAVFCMRFLPGFEAQILESLKNKEHEIFYEAVLAAGTWAVEGAWEHVSPLLNQTEDRDLLLAAIEVIPELQPDLADELLADFLKSDDED
ncbi:MAG: hypothetical protein KAI47_11955, partial [Deltaproteobacteria bacterium]|nr:hypothetical protein [Deltaproteobacteria bacterium]